MLLKKYDSKTTFEITHKCIQIFLDSIFQYDIDKKNSLIDTCNFIFSDLDDVLEKAKYKSNLIIDIGNEFISFIRNCKIEEVFDVLNSMKITTYFCNLEKYDKL